MLQLIALNTKKNIAGVESYAWYEPSTGQIYYDTNYTLTAPLLEELFHLYQHNMLPGMSLGDLEFEAKCFLSMAIMENPMAITSLVPDNIWNAFQMYVNNSTETNFNNANSVLVLRISGHYKGAVYRNADLPNYHRIRK